MIAPATQFAPVSVETGEPIKLAMQKLFLKGTVLPCGGRLRVTHTFCSQEQKPLEVVYVFALPPDAAMRRFVVKGQNFKVYSQLKEVKESREIYENAISRGNLAALARQYGDGIVNLSLGNIRPGELVVVELEIVAGVETHDNGYRFCFPFTMAPCYHSQARVGFDGARVEVELPEEIFDDVLLPPWLLEQDGLHRIGFELDVYAAQQRASISCRNFPIQVEYLNGRRARVRSVAQNHVPTSDLMLDVQNGKPAAWAGYGQDQKGLNRLIAVVPSQQLPASTGKVRRVVLVIDQSGSMSGTPLEQAKRAVKACLSALGPEDEFGLVSFESSVHVFEGKLVRATDQARQRAGQFVDALEATGGTELGQGLEVAIKLLGAAGGDILLVTDGEVYQTEAIINRCKNRVRVHTLGIGVASQQRFLQQLARQTGAISRFIAPSERVDWPMLQLFQAVGNGVPLEVDHIEWSNGTHCTLDVDLPGTCYPGVPLVVYASWQGQNGDFSAESLYLVTKTGDRYPLNVRLSPLPQGEVLRLLTGARLIADTDAELDTTDGENKTKRRHYNRLQERLRALSCEYGLASRQMALVAVVERPGDRPGEPPHTKVVPLGFPQEKLLEGYVPACYPPDCMNMVTSAYKVASSVSPSSVLKMLTGGLQFLRRIEAMPMELSVKYVISQEAQDDDTWLWSKLAALREDGGLGDGNVEQRVLATLFLLLEMAQRATELLGVFDAHRKRIVAFLTSQASKLSVERQQLVQAVVTAVEHGQSFPGSWQHVPSDTDKAWAMVQQAVSGNPVTE